MTRARKLPTTPAPCAPDPHTYLSLANGRWSLIHRSEPLCAPTTRERCLDVLHAGNRRGYGAPMRLTAVYWDGEIGAFMPDPAFVPDPA